MHFILQTLTLGLTNLMLHKLRSLLTALGIIFGVGAVILMVAIGEGNKQRALRDIEALGASNVIIRSQKPVSSTSAGQTRQRTLAYGIRRIDLRRIEATVKPVRHIVPLKRVGTQAISGQHQSQVEAFGTTLELKNVASLVVQRGRYLIDQDMIRLENVAVIGATVADRLFPLRDPLAGHVRIGEQAFKVVGVLQRIGLAGGSGSALVGRDWNFDIHIPLSTARTRFGDVMIRRSSGSFEREYVELSELYIQASSSDDVVPVAEQVRLIFNNSAHKSADDVTVIVPSELLYKLEREQRMFNAMMIAIAAISLLVGGIGIMNIMLASVTERTREIGIRRAMGATRRHIIAQFLVETTTLSGVGGILGIGLGMATAVAVGMVHSAIAGIEKPLLTPWPIVVSFAMATTVGIIFGLYPAIRAAQQDPIVALRHD